MNSTIVVFNQNLDERVNAPFNTKLISLDGYNCIPCFRGHCHRQCQGKSTKWAIVYTLKYNLDLRCKSSFLV